MLDHDRLKTPPGDGEVLILPAPRECASLLAENHAALRSSEIVMAGRPLSEWRRKTRLRVLGDPDRFAVVLGHQPEFIHPGVWAKHVVARRLADAAGGTALNLVVDNDTPRSNTLSIPTLRENRLVLEQIAVLPPMGRRIYEELPPLSRQRCDAIREDFRRCMGERFEHSMMPVFFDALTVQTEPRGGVSQLVTARRAVERELNVSIDDHRVSDLDWSPLLMEMASNPAQFAACYNAALSKYRMERRIRGNERPMPDLRIGGSEVELPVWAVRRGDARRRVFAAGGSGRNITLLAEGERIGEFDSADPEIWTSLVSQIDESAAWRLRPRAITLTLWARLFLADSFIHGIGGAKYDRICDDLIRGCFGCDPPGFMCVSATLRLDLPRRIADSGAPVAAPHQLRDWRWNPQRHVNGPEFDPLLKSRRAAVDRAEKLRADHAPSPDRRRAFESIRQSNQAILDRAQDQFRLFQTAAEANHAYADQERIAAGREYFFALHTHRSLKRLMDALPDVAAFRL